MSNVFKSQHDIIRFWIFVQIKQNMNWIVSFTVLVNIICYHYQSQAVFEHMLTEGKWLLEVAWVSF